MPGRSSPRRWPVVALAAVAVAGCGHVTDVRTGGTVQIALNEYRVTPQDVRTGSSQVTIVAHNYGRLTHDLVLTRAGVTAASTEPIAPGQTAELSATLAPGRYTMASNVLSDEALGAYGTLHVG